MKSFLQSEILIPRLRQTGVLVVYDPARRYRELCLELAADGRRVIDTSESSIESRTNALTALQQLGQPNPTLEGLLVYVPAARPLTDEAKQRDPFSIYGECGAFFPDGDGDEYLNLCLRAKADNPTEIRRIFAEDPNPSFAVIDAVGGGAGWPQLQGLLGLDSARDILFALLVPTEPQKKAFTGNDAWGVEAKALCLSTLGLQTKTRSKNWTPIADELWRFLLFSEFVFDLPVSLPVALADVPHARTEARTLVEDLCDRLRNDRRTQALYITRAESIEKELNLLGSCQNIEDLGQRDTFPFEERTFFGQAVDALKRDNVDRLRQTLARHEHSVWTGRGENQAQWQLLQATANLVETCDDADRELPDHIKSQDDLLDYYVTGLREVDRLQREFEQAAGDYLGASQEMAAIRRQGRVAYRRLADKAQGVFIRHMVNSGWPPAGRLANVDVFDKIVAPKLEESGRRVALLLIDALRFELGVELAKQLAEEGQVETQPAFAQLPSVTPVGMASLLPGASQNLQLARKDAQMVPVLDGKILSTVNGRMDILRGRYGQRFGEAGLSEFARGNAQVPGTVELLVLRSNEMDDDFEHNPETALTLVTRTFQFIRTALRRLRDLGFQEAVIVTDHGFYLNAGAEAGDVCAKPAGNWVAVHDRLLLGDGIGDAANFVLPAATLDIRGDFSQVAGPRALVAYRAKQDYFHGGASLQETVVPVISVKLRVPEQKHGQQPSVTLTYKRGTKKITTRLPMIEVEVGSGDLFSMDTTFDILLEAQNKQGHVVGEPRPGGVVNAATRTLSLKPGDSLQVMLKMDLEFEGKFAVKALDPTTMQTFSKLELETDYTV